MHKGTHRSREEYRVEYRDEFRDEFQDEYQDDSQSHSFKNKHRAGRERNDGSHHKSSVRDSQWLFGNLFECLSDDKNCSHGRVPFGDSFYCTLPLKDTSAGVPRNRPCLWDAEKDTPQKEDTVDEDR